MKNIDKWIQGKPVGMAFPSLELAFQATTTYEYLKLFGDSEGLRKINAIFPLPQFTEWIATYENTALISMLLGICKNMGGFGQELGGLIEKTREPRNMDEGTIEIVKQSLGTIESLRDETSKEGDSAGAAAWWLNVGALNLDSIREDMSSASGSAMEGFMQLLQGPIVSFAVRVLLPSFLLYQRNPQELFQEARSGKVHSLAKLLVIDKEVLRDETIFRVFTNAARKDKQTDYNILTKALRQNAGDIFTLREIKVAIARFILDVSKFFGSPLKMPEIRNLFDYIEKDREKDDTVIDEEGIHDSQDSFYKAVMRHPGFESLLQPKSDKKI